MADKYLDITGVQQLWNAIKGRTNTLSETIDASKASFIDYDSVEKKIHLYDKENGTVLSSIDASPFIADGMLNDVTIISSSVDNPITYEDDNKTYTNGAKFIKFTWNTASGNKTDYIKLDEIAKTYTSSASIGINADEGNMLYVKEVDDNKVKTDKIVLGGTPLAKYIIANGGPTEIAAGNLQDLLIALLSEDIYPSGTRGSFTGLSLSFGDPTYNFSTSGTLEAGSTLTFTAECKKASASKTISFTGFDYGHSESLTGNIVTGKPGDISVTGETNTNKKKKKIVVTGFNNATISEVTGNNTTPAKLSSTTLTVGEGSNSIKITATSPSFHAKSPRIPTYYIVSSLGNRTADKVCTGASASESYNLNANSETRNTTTSTVTGARKLFYKCSGSSIDYSTSANIRGLGNSSFKTSKLTLTIPQDTKEIVLAMPAGWNITKIIDKGTNYDITSNLAKVDDAGVQVHGANNYAATTYYVYKYTSAAKMDANSWEISIS